MSSLFFTYGKYCTFAADGSIKDTYLIYNEDHKLTNYSMSSFKDSKYYISKENTIVDLSKIKSYKFERRWYVDYATNVTGLKKDTHPEAALLVYGSHSYLALDTIANIEGFLDAMIKYNPELGESIKLRYIMKDFD